MSSEILLSIPMFFVGTYDDLRQQAHQLEKTERFQYEPYLHSYEPVTEETEYATNLFQVTHYPETLYIIETTEEAESARVSKLQQRGVSHQASRAEVIFSGSSGPSSGVYSSLPPRGPFRNPRFRGVPSNGCSRGRARKHRKIASQEYSPSLLEITIDCLIDREKGTTVYPELDRKQHGTERKLGRSWVAKELDSYPDVIHRGVKVRVRRYAGEYYYVLLPTQVFTSDGRRPVKGERKSRLQNDFSPNRFHAQNQYLTKHPRLAVSAA